MFRLKNTPPRSHIWDYPILLAVTTLQYVWVAALMCNPVVINVTAVYPLRIFGGWLTTLLLLTATLSIIGFFARRKFYVLLAFIPQQFIMLIAAIGGVHAIWDSRFADGIVRSRAFLFADQSPTILLAIFHTWALILILAHQNKD